MKRFECSEERGALFDSLYLATCEPPRDPEARVTGHGGVLLAESDPERVAWRFTAVGNEMLAMEAHAEHMQDVREEIADEMRGERAREYADRSW